MIGKAVKLVSANAVHSVLLFLRNIVIARLIPIEDYGIAATFALVMAALEMATQIGLHQLIVQDSDGDDADFQAGTQGFHLFRMLLAAAVLLAGASWVADFLGVAGQAWAFRVLALAIIARGLLHFDIYRLQRHMDFSPQIWGQIGAPLVAFIAIYPLARIYGDYRVMLYSIVLQQVMFSVLSHLKASRRYRVAFDRALIIRTMRFGWPLLLNGSVLFLILQGERLIVARQFDLTTLGVFSMALTVTMTPAMLLSRTFASIMLPQLSAAQDDDARFARLGRLCIELSLLMGMLSVVLAILVTAPLILMVVGDKFTAMLPMIPWLALVMGVRIFRSGATVPAIARARTQSVFAANLFRLAALPVAWLAVSWLGAGLTVILWVALAGEAAAQLAGLVLMQRRVGADPWPTLPAMVAAWGFCAAVGLHAWSVQRAGGPAIAPAVTLALVAVGFAAALAALRELRARALARVRP